MTLMTLQELQKRTMDMLSQAGIADAGRETRWLLKHALGVSDADLIAGARLAAIVAEADQLVRILSTIIVNSNR